MLRSGSAKSRRLSVEFEDPEQFSSRRSVPVVSEPVVLQCGSCAAEV